MKLDYQLTEKDVNLNLLSDKELKDLRNKYANDSEHQMWMEAIRITIPRMKRISTEQSGIKLTANDVHSIMLTKEEAAEIEKNYNEATIQIHENIFKLLYQQLQDKKDAEYDRIAKEAGFAQFDENEEGTGVRNYTALKKPMNAKIKEQMEEFNRLYRLSARTGAMKEFSRIYKMLFDYNLNLRNECAQIMLRHILEKTNPRITRQDANGYAILSPGMYLEQLNNLPDKEAREIFKQPWTTKIETTVDNKNYSFNVDKGIAPYIKELMDAGYLTGQSCSGLLEDHPNYRYVQDDENGRYVNGECIFYNKQGSGAYLTFYKPMEGIGMTNMAEQIANIRAVAQKNHWIVEDTEIFGYKSIRLGLPQTYDGTGKREILHEVDKVVNKENPGLYEKNFFAWLEKRNRLVPEFEKEHGGVVRWTDEMIKEKWKTLTVALVQAEKQRQNMERISDVRIFANGKQQWRIKCRVDGVDMLSKEMNLQDKMAFDKGEDKKTVAFKYFGEELKVQKQMNIKR